MALVKASKTSELRALDIRFRVYRLNGVVFKLTSFTRKRTPGLSPRSSFLLDSLVTKRLCVVECLKFYEKKTRVFRQPESGEKPLLLSYICPHNPLTSQRLAHWFKDLLADAGVDESFKAHSVWGALTAAAMARGVPMADILGNADWSRVHVQALLLQRNQDHQICVKGPSRG